MTKPYVKYCGAVTQKDVDCIAQSQADAIGFIFAPSKRQVHPDQVKQWLAQTKCEKDTAGVFVNEKIQKVCDIIKYIPLDIVQLHGDETREHAKRNKRANRGYCMESISPRAQFNRNARKNDGICALCLRLSH